MYGYGYRYNSGLVVSAGGGAPFANTYSLSFDGIDDYLNLGRITAMEGATNFSFSMWVYPTSYAGVRRLFGKIASATDFFQANTTNEFGYIQWYIADGQTNYPRVQTSSRIDLNNWGLLTFVYDGSLSGNLNKAKIYINGTLASNTTTAYQMPSSISLDTTDFYVAQRGGNPSTPTAGNIDEVSLYDYSLSASEVSDIYNLGTPTDLSLLATPPLHWYRNGDNGAYKSPQWLIPNNENKDKVSNYSFEFDGVDDYLVIANNTTIGRTQNISFSVWVNLGATSRQYIIGNTTSSNGGAGLAVESGNNLVFQIGDGTNDSFFNSRVSSFSTYAPINTWNHILATWDGTDAKIYINGVLRNTWSPTLPYIINYSGAFDIGWRGFGAYKTNGKLDELALFDSGVSIGDVWDGSGQPIDVSAVSGITNNWRMGEEATFSGGVWTVPDAVGSNNGTSNGMTIEDRIGEAPNSASNSVSYNMDEVDRVEDTP